MSMYRVRATNTQHFTFDVEADFAAAAAEAADYIDMEHWTPQGGAHFEQNRGEAPELLREPWEPDSHWDSHPVHTAGEYRDDVYEGNTRQSYVEWVNNRLEDD